MLIFHCVTLANFFSFQSLPSLGHVSHLFPILSLIFCFLFAFLLPSLTVTFYPTFPLPFWPFFSPTLPLLFTQRFHSLFSPSSPLLCRYSLPNNSTAFLALLLPIFFSISYYRYSSYNSSPPFFSLLLPIIPYLIIIISPPIFSPLYSSSPYLIFNKFAINSFTSLSSIQTMFCLRNNLSTLLISFNEFFLTTLLMSFCVLKALLWVDVF